MIDYCAEDIEMPLFDSKLMDEWIEAVASSYDKQLGELCYIFCSDAYILNVNKEHLNHDYYTDVITFDYCESDIISGDLFISLDTVKSNAEKFSEKYDREFLRVVIHGILHLCGFPDKADDEAVVMRAQEEKALALFDALA